MKTLATGNQELDSKLVLSAVHLTLPYLAGYDDSNRPFKGFWKKLWYQPTPVYQDGSFYVVRYALDPDNLHVRCGVTHYTGYYCVCSRKEVYDALKEEVLSCQKEYSKAPNEKRTRLERSDTFRRLTKLGLVPSLVQEPDADDPSGMAEAWARSRGAGFITYSYLQSDFEEFCTDVLRLDEKAGDYPEV